MDISTWTESSSTPLIELPTEIQFLIFSKLDFQSLANIRLTHSVLKNTVDSEYFWFFCIRAFLQKHNIPQKQEMLDFMVQTFHQKSPQRFSFLPGNYRLTQEILKSPNQSMEMSCLSNLGHMPQPVIRLGSGGQAANHLLDYSPNSPLQYHESAIQCVEISESGLFAATGALGSSSNLKVWDLVQNKLHKTITAHQSDIYLIKISGIDLFSADKAGAVASSDMLTGVTSKVRQLHSSQVTLLMIDGKNSTGITSDVGSNEILIWNKSTLDVLRRFHHQKEITLARLSKNHNGMVYSADSSNTLSYWSHLTGDIHSAIKAKIQHRAPFNLHPTIEAAYFRAPEGALACWIPGEDKIQYITPNHSDSISHIAFLPDLQKVLLAGGNRVLRLHDCATGDILKEYSGDHTRLLRFLLIAGDGKYAISGCGDGVMHLWCIETGAVIQSAYHQRALTGAALGSDNRTLLTVGEDYTLRKWGVIPSAERTSSTTPSPQPVDIS